MDVRAHLLSALRAELVGPYDLKALQAERPAHEVLPLAPTQRYLTGFLSPPQLDTEAESAREEEADPFAAEALEGDDDFGAGSDKEADDSPTPDPEPATRKVFAASVGMSVLLPPEATQVVGSANFTDAGQHRGRRVRAQPRVRAHDARTVAGIDRQRLAARRDAGCLRGPVGGSSMRSRSCPTSRRSGSTPARSKPQSRQLVGFETGLTAVSPLVAQVHARSMLLRPDSTYIDEATKQARRIFPDGTAWLYFQSRLPAPEVFKNTVLDGAIGVAGELGLATFANAEWQNCCRRSSRRRTRGR